ncbi:MAG TPA: FAD-dependent oxidoreductase, partial [Gemmatimonadota bacterium]|nr:FAD-dependent oxidoreductase [Gemmatimonadota bacterium]
MSRVDAEILVVGAGPSGAWTARRLAEAGRDVILADENEGPRTDVVCTGIVGTEAFGRLPLPTSAVTDQVRRAFFFSPGGRAVPYEPSRPLARVVDRTRFDAALAEEARAAGTLVLRGHAAREVRKASHGVEVRCRTAGGERTLR